MAHATDERFEAAALTDAICDVIDTVAKAIARDRDDATQTTANSTPEEPEHSYIAFCCALNTAVAAAEEERQR